MKDECRFGEQDEWWDYLHKAANPKSRAYAPKESTAIKSTLLKLCSQFGAAIRGIETNDPETVQAALLSLESLEKAIGGMNDIYRGRSRRFVQKHQRPDELVDNDWLIIVRAFWLLKRCLGFFWSERPTFLVQHHRTYEHRLARCFAGDRVRPAAVYWWTSFTRDGRPVYRFPCRMIVENRFAKEIARLNLPDDSLSVMHDKHSGATWFEFDYVKCEPLIGKIEEIREELAKEGHLYRN